MKFRFPLYAQIISVFVLNLVLLGCLLFAFFGKQTNFGWKNFLYGSIGDRVQSMAMDIHWKLRSKTRDKWNAILSEFGSYYGVKLAIFDSTGRQVAGEKLLLPEEIQRRVTAPHFRMPPPAMISGFAIAAPVTVTAPVAGTVEIQGATPITSTKTITGTAPTSGTTLVAGTAGIMVPQPPNLPTAGGISVPPIAFTSDPQLPGSGISTPSGSSFHTMTSPEATIAVRAFPFDEPSHHQRHHGPPPDHPLGPPHDRPHGPRHKFPFDHFMFGSPGGPPRFIINTKNPDRCWIGAMIPTISPEDEASTVNHTITTLTPANNSGTIEHPFAIEQKPPNLTTTQKFHIAQLRRIPMPGFLIAVTPNVWSTRLVSDVTNVFLMIGGLFCLSLIVWFPFVHQMTRALGKLTMATEEIADGKFDSVLTVKRWDEIGRLGSAINTMSSRLNTYVTGQKRFLGDIAHELCSPVARLQVGIELLESSSKPDQNATIQDIREEVEQMSMLINELLAFSKASVRGRETQLTSIDLTMVLQETKAKIEAGFIVPCQTVSNGTPLSSSPVTVSPLSNTNLSHQDGISISNQSSIILNAQPGIYCLGDTMLLKRALENILRNAVRYAGAFGPISVDCTRNGDYVMISVVDCGPGVPEEAIESLGQPFYRLEESRSRSSGGVGLGLAIVKTCVEACNGSFSISNAQPNGLRVDIILSASESSVQ